MAEFGDVGLDADDVLRAQLIGFALEAIDRDFARVVNEARQFADLAAVEDLKAAKKLPVTRANRSRWTSAA